MNIFSLEFFVVSVIAGLCCTAAYLFCQVQLLWQLLREHAERMAELQEWLAVLLQNDKGEGGRDE